MSRASFALSLPLVLLVACGGDDKPAPDVGTDTGTADQSKTADQKAGDLGVRPNSGIICTKDTDCAAGDKCLGFGVGAGKMCVMPCTPGDSCPVPSLGKNSSQCLLSSGSGHFCVWFCEYQGMKYSCPVEGAYDCVVYDSTKPGQKICQPK